MVPRRDSFWFLPESTRWTMNWSVHQYQKPMMAEPKRAPYHGNSGSFPLRIRSVIVSPYSLTGCALQMSIMAFQPPSSRRPSQRMTSEPTSRIGVCRTEVLSTDSMPPMTV